MEGTVTGLGAQRNRCVAENVAPGSDPRGPRRAVGSADKAEAK